ncbi:MMPL family transporter [Nocardia sp. NBC_01503]|uniref:MMPL family transporter n=1 Tax=Nocardia sp. NBC_01503 TaxID=2975997 RepID=UPI002E7BD2F5|nr:MMPL family transporter [Nocardia sp. NBC_01503]WTL32079.1 MMPL family transporter [Nocardia sp. NBC_01503]
MLIRIAEFAQRRARAVLVAAGLAAVLCYIVGGSAPMHLKSGGFQAPNSESTWVDRYLDQHFPGAAPNVVLVLTADGGIDGPAATTVGQQVTGELRADPDLQGVQSYWDVAAEMRPALRSTDRDSAVIVAFARGDDTAAPKLAGALADKYNGSRDGVRIRAGGEAVALAQMSEQATLDLVKVEAIAIPLAGIVLVLVFGSLFASMLPLLVGVVTIGAALAVLRVLSAFGDVSIFALNMTTALGFAVALDSSLFMVSRFREELAAGADTAAAVVRTVRTAGRTVLYSGLTVALSLAALLIFPLYFLRSFAYAGLAVLAAAVFTTLLVLPAALALMGSRVEALDVRQYLRRRLGRPDPVPGPVEADRWYRFAMGVMRRPVLAIAGVVALLLLLGSPFLNVRFGWADDRVLASGSSREVGDISRTGFSENLTSGILAVLPDTHGDPAALGAYAHTLSQVPGVTSVLSAGGVFAGGLQVAAAQSAMTGDAGAYLRIGTRLDPYSKAATEQLDTLRAVPAPGRVLFGGPAARNADSISALASRIPLALTLIALSMFVVLLIFTRSVILPIKALLLTVLSLTATFGAMVWIFQDGHFAGLLGFTPTGFLIPTMPILMFCLAFGVSMDYEVFLLSRIREEYLTSGATGRAVAVGLARTARIFTAAAALLAIAFVGMVFAGVSFVQLFGLGLTLAVLVDATIIRTILVPALMQTMGRLNWWAPIRRHATPELSAETVA